MTRIKQAHTINQGKLTVLSLALASALAAMLPIQAQAQTTTTITSADGSGSVPWNSDNLLLNTTASVTNVAINSLSLGTLTNQGSIAGIVNSGSTIASIINDNNALMSGGLYAIENGGTIASFSNSGTISGGVIAGIYNTGTIISLSNTADGLITASGSAIVNNDSIETIDNAGTITGTRGVYSSGSITSLSNASGALISGTQEGIQNNGGTIISLSNDGVISGSTIYNSSYTAAGILNNYSTYNSISGSISTLTNSGSISGYYGIYNSGNIDTLNNTISISGSTTLTGSIGGNLYGIHNDTIGSIGLLSNAASISGINAVNNAGYIGTLSNTETGIISSNGVINGNGFGVNNASGGTIGLLDNAGTITGINIGIYNRGSIGTLNNTGTISGDATGVFSGSGGSIDLLSNSGTIHSVNSAALNNTGIIGTVNNTGIISSGAYAIYNSDLISTLGNSGLISGPTAILNDTGGTIETIVNTGTIAGSIINYSSNALTIVGGSGTIFGTLTGSSGSIGAADIGNITTSADLTFASGNQLLNDNITASTVINSAVLQLNNPVTITGNYVQDAGATLLIGVTSGATFSTGLTDTGYGRLVVNGNAVIASGSAITLKTLGYSFAQGQRYVVVASNGGGTNYNASTLVYSATGYTVTASVQTDSGNSAYSDLVLTLGSTDSSGNSSNSSSGDSSSTKPNNNATTSNASSALAGLFKYSGTDAALLAVFNPAAALDSTASANKAGAQLSPAAVTGAATQAIDAASKAVSNIVTSHQDGYRLAQNGSSGVATGESHNDIAVWGQVFGGRATQGERDSVSGYHANYRGLLIGADGSVTDRIRAGGLISASKTSVASDGDNTGSSADVNSYGITAYATYTGNPWYLNVQAGAARQQYSTVRNISYTGFAGTADGSFHGSQYLTSVQAGYPLNLDAWLPGATLTPIAGLSYSTLRQNGYTETGGSGAALSVNATNSNSLKSELGAKLENSYEVSYGKLLPTVQLGWRHEYRDDATQTGASFVADSTGSTVFVTKTATPVANLAVLTLGLTLLKNSNLSLTGKYTLESGGGYTGQTGSVQVRWQY